MVPGKPEELPARDTRWTRWMRLCTYVVAQGSPDEDPVPCSSPDPRADGMLKGGDLPAGGFPQHWNAISPGSCCPRGLSHPKHWVGASPQLQLCPRCATSFLPNVILTSSSHRVCAALLAGSCLPLGRGMGPGLEVCRTWGSFAHGHQRGGGMRI